MSISDNGRVVFCERCNKLNEIIDAFDLTRNVPISYAWICKYCGHANDVKYHNSELKRMGLPPRFYFKE